jgi:hypothetical protein
MTKTPRAKRPKPRIPLPMKPPKVFEPADAYKRRPKHKKPIDIEPPEKAARSFISGKVDAAYRPTSNS